MIYTQQDFVLAQTLAQLARTVPVPIGYLWPTLFPQTQITSNKFKFDKEIAQIIMAEFHAIDADVIQLPRRDIVFTEGTLGSIGAQRGLRTDELVEAVLAGRLERIEATDLEDIVNSIYATVEFCSMNALFEGEINLSNGYGVSYTLNYGTHGVDTSPVTAWNVPATATPVADIISWSDSIEDITGFKPPLYLTSLKQIRNILNAKDTKEQIIKWANATGAISLAQLNQLLSEVHGLGPIVAYDQKTKRIDTSDHSLETIRMTDENIFIGLPPVEVTPSPGLLLSGVTAEAAVAYQDVRKDLDEAAEGLWIDVLTERTPSVRRRMRGKMAMIPVFPYIGQTLRSEVQ